MDELVSIIMASYNTGKYIAQTIDSVLAQTYGNWELIIVDDCSDDNTMDVIAKYLEDPRISFVKNEKNSGAAVSRNRALRLAKGKWIAFLDSDDLWHPKKLEKQVAFMGANGYDFSYTCYEEIDEASRPLGKLVSGPSKISKAGMFLYCWPGCLTVMYNAEVVGLVQIADIRRHNDYAMWLKICRKASCYLLKDNLAWYRKRCGSISRRSYMTLIRWHYKLFRQAEGRSIIASVYSTFWNLVFGVLKKLFYVKRGYKP